MIQLPGVSLAFGGRSILDGLSWTIKPQRRIGLIGANGAGKTTLLRVLAKLQEADEGHVAGDVKVGYLAQDAQEVSSFRTVLEEAMHAFAHIEQLRNQEYRTTLELGQHADPSSDGYSKLLQKLDRVQTQLAAHDTSRIRPQTEAVLAGLGFENADMDRPLRTLSGGYRMRVSLAQILLRQPQLLLLDEPTNHLDIVSIAWLESYLKSYIGSVVFVSHDRYFLNRMATSIAHLSRGKITEYAGNYSFFLAEREKRRVLEQAAYDNQQREIAQTRRFIERFRYKNTKARQVQSRIKHLARMERLLPPESDEAEMTVRFPTPRKSGRTVMELSEFSKSYNDNPPVFECAGPLHIERGAKIALIGKNGAGKSTLARILHGTEPFDGTRKVGHNVDLTFFAQHQAESLAPQHTALESLQQVSVGKTEGELRSLLGAFLLRGDDVFKPVHVLSGGEKSRLALARTLVNPANYLILDEPTNHLDIQSIQVLIEALRQYQGTFVVVSHDRHFLDRIVNAIWYVEGGSVHVYKGNYTDFEWYRQHGTVRQVQDASVRTAQPEHARRTRKGGPKSKEQKRREARERQRVYEAASQPAPADSLPGSSIRALCSETEKAIQAAEEKRSQVEALLADPAVYADPERAADVTSRYAALDQDLKQLYARWEELVEQLEVT